MASLIEELVTVLTEEANVYEQLVPVAEAKTPVIVENNLEKLQAITEREQELVDMVTQLENQRMRVVRNMAIVLGRKEAELNSKEIIESLIREPNQQKELKRLHDQLRQTLKRLMEINNRNKELINQSLEMIEFNMNFIQSTRMAPGNNNYTKGAVNRMMGAPNSQMQMFDAKR